MHRQAEFSAHHGDGDAPDYPRLAAVFLIFVLLVVSVVPWRSGTYFEGGVDSVVVGKAATAVVALSAAAVLWTRTRVRVPIGLAPAGVMLVVGLISLLGSVVAGNGAATGTLVVRMLIVMATLLLLLTSTTWTTALGGLLAAMAAVGMTAAVTGIGSLIARGRLYGGIPEIHPNELAGLVGPPLVATVIVTLRSGVRWWAVSAAAVLLSVLVLTGSRTALAGVLVAAAVAVLVNGIRLRGVLVFLLAATPLVYAVIAFTGLVGDLATRGGSTDTTSAFDSRVDAWRVVWGWEWLSWEKWIGTGLSVKVITVNLQWRETQVLDSSWASLLVQTGLIGTVLVAMLLAWCVVTALTARARRGVLLPFLVLIIMRSVTESGLVDSAMPFVFLLTVATLLTHRSRHAAEALAHRCDARSSPSHRLAPFV